MTSNERNSRVRDLLRAVKTGRRVYSAQRNARRIWVWLLVAVAAIVAVTVLLAGGDDDDDDDDDLGMGISVVQVG